MIYWCKMVVCVLYLHILLEWPWLGRNSSLYYSIWGATFTKRTPTVYFALSGLCLWPTFHAWMTVVRKKWLVLGHEETYFVKEHTDSKTKHSEDEIIKMLEFSFLLTILSWFLPEKSSSRQSAFQWVRIVPRFSPTSFCIHTKRISYNICSQRKINISISVQSHLQVHRWCNSKIMYPAELEIKDNTESRTSASYLDLLLSIGRDGQLHTSIYD